MTPEFKLTVPTYNGNRYPAKVASRELPEFGGPEMPLLAYEAAGLRVVLGTHDRSDSDKPDLQIERQPNGWVIFLHPYGGGDPSGHVYFLDDGRSFVVPELGLGSTPAIRTLPENAIVPEMGASLDDSRSWPQAYERQSKREGWALFNADGVLAIQRLDDPQEVAADMRIKIKPLASDKAALEHVVDRALAGSPMHALALFLEGQPSCEPRYIPVRLRESQPDANGSTAASKQNVV